MSTEQVISRDLDIHLHLIEVESVGQGRQLYGGPGR